MVASTVGTTSKRPSRPQRQAPDWGRSRGPLRRRSRPGHSYGRRPEIANDPGPGRDHLRSARYGGKHSGLVRTALLANDHAEPVGRVDPGDNADQRGDLVVVVVLAHLGPGLVGHALVGVGEPGTLLGERQRGPLGLGEHSGLAPGG